MNISIKRGLDLPISGAPEQSISDGPPIRMVSVLGRDYVGLKPTMAVEEGDPVELGQPLFRDKHNPGLVIVAPGAGIVREVRRGPRRILQAVRIELDGDAHRNFPAHAPDELAGMARDDVQERLVESGLWTSFRTRPYSKVPVPGEPPAGIFVTAIDSNPLAADPAVVIADARDDFLNGVTILTRLTDGPVHVCRRQGSAVPAPDLPQVITADFDGPHPSGLPGTHIHFLQPVHAGRTVWYLNYQDVIAIGRLFTLGRLVPERVIAFAGPSVRSPRLLRTRMGAHVVPILEGHVEKGEIRVISGSVFAGYRAAGWSGYLGRYHLQLAVLPEARDRDFLGWIMPGSKKFSVTNAFLSSLSRGRKHFGLNTSQNGSPRAMVPIGSYERVMPLDILPTQLLRAIVVKDTDAAQKLGCLELDEEDLALCTFVCPGKYDYGPMLRQNLEQIEKEG
jgi:Na+-transporting NADH:ubiquinone oxidoreductase subunit A